MRALIFISLALILLDAGCGERKFTAPGHVWTPPMPKAKR